jgi:hypothetical protein
VYDLEKCEFVEPNKEEYMIISTGYIYREPTLAEIDKLNKLLGHVFPIQEEKT